MSLNNPASSEQTSSRPGTSTQHSDRRGDEAVDTRPPVPVGSPTYDGAVDEGVNTTGIYDDEPDPQPVHAFQPFFTVIEDAHTSEYHHPTVHYIFSDDDTDIVTEAAIRSLEAHKDTSGRKDEPPNPLDDPNQPDNEKSTLLQPHIAGVRENYVVLDIEPARNTPANINPTRSNPIAVGADATASTSPPPTIQPNAQQSPGSNLSPMQYRMTSAKSFSPTWQVLRTELVAAPTFENQDPGVSPGNGLMLKIYGTGGLPAEIGRDRDRERGPLQLEEMMDQFATRMQELQRVIDAADVVARDDVRLGEGTTDDRNEDKGEQPTLLDG